MKQTNEYQKVRKLFEKYTSFATIKKHCNTTTMLEIANKIYEREKFSNLYDNKKLYNISVSDFCKKLIEFRLKRIAASLPATGYSMGDLRQVQFSTIIGEYDDREFYSKSCKYKEKHGSVKVILTLEELKNCRVIGGVVTFVAPGQRGKLKKCTWLDARGKKNTFELVRVKGYLYYNYHNADKNLALKIGKENEKREFRIAQKIAARSLYSFENSLNAGNCEAGTRLFLRRLNLDISASYKGTYLLKLIEKNNLAMYERYVNRMINDRATRIITTKK